MHPLLASILPGTLTYAQALTLADQIKQQGGLPGGVTSGTAAGATYYGSSGTGLERLLQPAELERILEVSSLAVFEGLPDWRRQALRKKAGLWVR